MAFRPLQTQLILTADTDPTFLVRAFSTAQAAAAAGEDETYYDLLGVSRHATPKEVKKAFRERAKECHPDALDTSKLSTDEVDDLTTEFQKLNEAFSVLSSDLLRRQYDRKIAAGDPSGPVVPDDNSPGQHMTTAEATARGNEFVEKDTNKVAQWYVGQEAMTKEQEFFYKRLEKHERKTAVRQNIAANTRQAIKPLSRARSLVWLSTPALIAGFLGTVYMVGSKMSE